ncbi:hypothetical protein ABIF91_007921 [Bradyrhizobium sp. USDA 241]
MATRVVTAGLNCRHAVVEIVHVELEEFALLDLGLLDAGVVAGKVGEDTHDKRQLDQPLGVVGIFVGDVHARCAVSPNEFLTAVRSHGCPLYKIALETDLRDAG